MINTKNIVIEIIPSAFKNGGYNLQHYELKGKILKKKAGGWLATKKEVNHYLKVQKFN